MAPVASDEMQPFHMMNTCTTIPSPAPGHVGKHRQEVVDAGLCACSGRSGKGVTDWGRLGEVGGGSPDLTRTLQKAVHEGDGCRVLKASKGGVLWTRM